MFIFDINICSDRNIASLGMKCPSFSVSRLQHIVKNPPISQPYRENPGLRTKIFRLLIIYENFGDWLPETRGSTLDPRLAMSKSVLPFSSKIPVDSDK